MRAPDRRARFDALYAGNADRVMAYCLRHADVASAEDVVADTFLVAWRRLDAVPEPPIAWLLTTARHHLGNRWRSARRGRSAFERLSAEHPRAASSAEDVAVRRAAVFGVLAALPVADREALLLTVWDGLTYDEAAGVPGHHTGRTPLPGSSSASQARRG